MKPRERRCCCGQYIGIITPDNALQVGSIIIETTTARCEQCGRRIEWGPARNGWEVLDARLDGIVTRFARKGAKTCTRI